LPIYEYECNDCGLRFEKMRKMAESADPTPCPGCGVPDAKKLVSPTNFAFAHKVEGGPRPQNTGIHSIDYNVDRVIGRDAEQRWKTIGERAKHKDGVVQDARKSGQLVTRDHLTRTVDGTYRTLTESERTAANQGRELFRQAQKSVETSVQTAKKGEG
jgi:putative FmdB family regulatory protein